MAILIEEEKKNGGSWFGFGLLFIILTILGVAAYYLFFVKPEIIGNVTSTKTTAIDDLAQIDFDPNSVVNGDFFKTLKQVVPPPVAQQGSNFTPFGVF